MHSKQSSENSRSTPGSAVRKIVGLRQGPRYVQELGFSGFAHVAAVDIINNQPRLSYAKLAIFIEALRPGCVV